MRRLGTLLMLAASGACSGPERIDQATELRAELEASPPVEAVPAPAKPLPVLGDPYGLLKLPPQPSAAPPRGASRASARPLDRLDPGALSAPNAAHPAQAPERDPRALERVEAATSSARRPAPSFSAEVDEKSAGEVLRDVTKGRGLPQVLFLYASYCSYCRTAMAPFLTLSQRYREQGVRFTAASVDKNREAFAAYAPTLGGQFPAWWVTPDTGMGHELSKLGVKLKESGSFGIPLFVVLDARQRVVSQGAGLEDMAHSLDGLLAQ
jgi:thiol-disulfide isomerase/thioredoxin